VSKENSKNSLKHNKRKSEDLQKEDNNDVQTLWASIARNYEMIQGAHIRNSFILLMAI
jgi:flagellar biosynthesis/type III secretory pathway chaperone